MASYSGTALIYSINRTDHWWRHVGLSMGFERCLTVADMRGQGDLNVADGFYAAYRRLRASGAESSDLLSADEVTDVIARCRVLRWYPRPKAAAMALAMTEALDKALDDVRPAVVISFPIDRYGKDVLARRARARGIPYFEFTTSAVPGMSMLLFRGRLVQRDAMPPAELVEEKRHELADPLFTPAYVRGQKAFSMPRFLRTFGYFRLRGWGFKAIGAVRQDPLNILYIDAQSSLGHKPRLSDLRITRLIDPDWETRIAAVPKERRLAMPLQLFPEASIDYWVTNRTLIDYEDVLVEAATAFAAAGFHILIKDHPLQFGFRQVGFIDRLKAVGPATVLPYEISGNEMLSLVDTYFGLTGTLGLQAALRGLRSITAENYYTNDDDFILLKDRSEIAALPDRAMATPNPADLQDRQNRIVEELLRGSFEGDYYSFRGFDPKRPSAAATALGQSLGRQVAALGPDGEDWHRRHGL